ncbi:MAG: hypothetical protein KI793_01300 [Rivularia sp. (in: Bacteria)]|nr:hypothetical protein [Rivularia sp. MS3]
MSVSVPQTSEPVHAERAAQGFPALREVAWFPPEVWGKNIFPPTSLHVSGAFSQSTTFQERDAEDIEKRGRRGNLNNSDVNGKDIT